MPNRIREFRDRRGWSRQELARRSGVHAKTIERYEKGGALKTEVLGKIAQALEASVSDILKAAAPPPGDDVQPANDTASLPPGVAASLRSRGIRLYRVHTDAVADAGIEPGMILAVDETTAAIEGRAAGDILLVRVRVPGALLLRQFLPPALLTTNRVSVRNESFKLTDQTIGVTIVGVVMPPAPER